MKNVLNNKESKLPPELYPLTIKDVELLLEKDPSTAWRRLKKLRKALKRNKRQPVFLTEFCKFYGYPLETACKFLNIKFRLERPTDSIDISPNSLTTNKAS